jgi:Concanavalin A-like lectin/glucanases superfamily/Domain of unknown function (DUF1929)/Bacterial Ig domain/Glyoxal oxidase N-terminus
MIRLLPRTVVALLGSLVLLTTLSSAGPAWSNVAAGDLVAAYAFNEGSGTGVADASGNGNAGVVQGATWSSAGKFGGALSFNGSSSRVRVPDSPPLDLTSALTVEAWVYPAAAQSGWRAVVQKEIDSYFLHASSSAGGLRPAGGATFGTQVPTLFSASALPVGTWSHLALTYDGAQLRLYLNGNQVASAARTGPITPSTTPLWMGGNSPYGEYFNGRIDEVRIYKTALTPSEIQTDMTTPVGATDPNGPKLHITAPAQNATVPGGTVNIAYNTTGSPVGVNHVYFQLDNEPERMDLSLDGSYSYSGAHVGSHTLKGWLVRADHSKITGSDAAPVALSNVVDPADPVSPVVVVTAPNAGSSVSGFVNVTANATDNVGVYGVQFRVDGVDLGAEDTAAPYAASWNTTVIGNGSHVVMAVARDAAGNETTAAPISVTVANSPTDPAQVGSWSTPGTLPIVPIHNSLLPNGKLLIFDSETHHSSNPRLWDPVANTVTQIPYNDTADLFCSGHTPLADGRILVAGGHAGGYIGIRNTTIFDPVTNSWTDVQPMTYPRWYPTTTKLPDGRILVVSGSTNCPECANPSVAHNGIADLPEIFNPATNTWSVLTAASLKLPLYPHMYVLPDGRVFAAATQEDPIASRVLDLTTKTWSVVDPSVRDGGSSAMYLPGKILKSGSARNPDYPPANATDTAWAIDMTQASPTWRQVDSMAYPRTQHQLTVLPDGTVLATGGSRNSDVEDTASAVLPAELWDPASETWRTLSSGVVPRLYHSMAILLPDGRVALGGGGHPADFGVPEFRFEIFSPPYLFKGQRPTISIAPGQANYGQTFFVGTPDAASISKVALIPQPTVTHAYNMNAGYVPLTFSQTPGGLTVTAPANGNLAPPGKYMLFILDSNGVPSVASWVSVSAQ